MDGKRECPLCGFYISDHETLYMNEDEAFVCTKSEGRPKTLERKLINWLDALENKELEDKEDE